MERGRADGGKNIWVWVSFSREPLIYFSVWKKVNCKVTNTYDEILALCVLAFSICHRLSPFHPLLLFCTQSHATKLNSFGHFCGYYYISICKKPSFMECIGSIVCDTYKTAKLNFINSGVVDIIKAAYYSNF